VKVPNIPEDNWVWSPQWVVNMHVPEKWGIIQFSTDRVNSTSFIKDPYWAARNVLLEVYYAQREFQSLSGYFTPDLNKLPLDDYILYGKCASIPVITPNSTTLSNYQVSVMPLDTEGVVAHITDSRLMWIDISH